MAALPNWATFRFTRTSSRRKPDQTPLEFVRSVYRETNGPTPALRNLVRSYKAEKASGAVRTVSADEAGKRS